MSYILITNYGARKKYIYNGKFEGNIWVLGKRDYEKITFVQRLALTHLFCK